MDGEFVGGCDIMLEMHQNGEFIDELKKVGIRSALLDEPDKKAWFAYCVINIIDYYDRFPFT